MMTVVVWVAAVLVGLAVFLALVRIVRGPSALDRAVALDVLLSCLIGGVGLEAAYNRHGTTLAVLAVLALLGFVGSVTIARFAAGEELTGAIGADDGPGHPRDPEADDEVGGPDGGDVRGPDDDDARGLVDDEARGPDDDDEVGGPDSHDEARGPDDDEREQGFS